MPLGLLTHGMGRIRLEQVVIKAVTPAAQREVAMSHHVRPPQYAWGYDWPDDCAPPRVTYTHPAHARVALQLPPASHVPASIPIGAPTSVPCSTKILAMRSCCLRCNLRRPCKPNPRLRSQHLQQIFQCCTHRNLRRCSKRPPRSPRFRKLRRTW
jgi:hypothetical protein